ncbi:hypothetical protein SDC9_90173 [bioreactor metagenome]|uniref:Secretion system C-terminal sorting domain-containing protein n=1 Tax=bioreactor metagenome TaxID=1076179 RepID=A0A644ZSX3_9ZZZZ
MKFFHASAIIFLLTATSIRAQIADPVLMCQLPSVLNESSGVETSNANSVWTHNDSGDSARIFNIDTTGNILRIVFFIVDTAFDCEESTRDANGNYYLGDFGNNLNNRTNLRIYKIPNPDTLSVDTIIPQIIFFRYPDQTLFPPDSALWNFDCEAMFHFQNSLYLFSKNRGTSTYSRMYRLPDQPGDYVAELVDSFNTGTWITSGDINPAGNMMILLSESRIWLFTGFTGTDFFGGNAQMIQMYTTQKEAVVFASDSTVYITDEYFLGTGGKLYRLDLRSWINGIHEDVSSTVFTMFPNPATEKISVCIPEQGNDFLISIFDNTGKMVRQCSNCREIDVSTLQKGHYFLHCFYGKTFLSGKFEKL